jgi:hypothetical protein
MDAKKTKPISRTISDIVSNFLIIAGSLIHIILPEPKALPTSQSRKNNVD